MIDNTYLRFLLISEISESEKIICKFCLNLSSQINFKFRDVIPRKLNETHKLHFQNNDFSNFEFFINLPAFEFFQLRMKLCFKSALEFRSLKLLNCQPYLYQLNNKGHL